MRVTVEPIVFLYNFGCTVHMSVQQDFILSRLCQQHYTEEECGAWWSVEGVALVQGEAVRMVMWISVITGLIAVISAQFLGAALDKYCHKNVMLVPFLGLVGQYLCCVVVAAVPWLPLYLLYLGAVIQGLVGGFVVFKSSVCTFVVTTSPPDAHTKRLSVAEAMLYLGSAGGPLVLQWLTLYVTKTHAKLFLVSEAVMVVAILNIILLLPDSYTHHKQDKEEVDNNNIFRNQINPAQDTTNKTCRSSERNRGYYGSLDDNQSNSARTVGTTSNSISNPYKKDNNPGCMNSCLSSACVRAVWEGFADALCVTFRRRGGSRRVAIVALIVADFFISIVFAAEFDILQLYMQDTFGFTLPQYNFFLGIKNLMNGISLLVVLPLLRGVLGGSDTALGVLGGLSRVVAFILLATTTSRSVVFAVPFVDMFGQYLFVVMRSVISSLVPESEQGRVMTVVAAIAQLSLLVGSLVFDLLFPLFLKVHLPGLTFMLAAASLAISTIILCYVQWLLKNDHDSDELHQPLAT